jgi:hypothetical protein
MQARRKNLFITIRTEGSILPADLLQRIEQADRELKGLTPEDYHLPGSEKINEAVSRSWTRMLGAWTSFKNAVEKAPAGDTNTSATRERWLLPLFQELGYGRLITARAIEIEGKPYPISHRWQHAPIHLVGSGVDLDGRAAGVAGAAKISPHSLVQEFLNRSAESLWGFVSNGLRLRILRDNVSLTRQAFVEFDLEAMMNGEVYSNFVLLWLLCHESRVEAARSEECWLERWSRAAQEQGILALEQLRNGVEEAIEIFGSGFLRHRRNQTLRDRLHTQQLSAQDYYRQILRLAYRLLFLFIAEDRELLLDPRIDGAAQMRYKRFYSVARLRKLAERRVGTRHADLFIALRLVMQKLGSDEGCAELGLPALGSFLFSPKAMPDIKDCELMNADLLEAIRALTFIADRHGRRLVDYKSLQSDALGSVYESLLELHPYFNTDEGTFELQTASGNERKTSGSYYTPESLVQCLLDSALDPALDEAAKQPDPQAAILDLKVCDPACGSGHFLIAAAHRIAKRLAAIRTGDEEPAPDALRKALRDVISRCIYGVDANPMAVELCKFSLWMEALEPGKPLSFLEQHIQVGNSLLGATPALLEKGIPDDAFKPIEGDDKATCAKFKKLNQEERLGIRRLFKEDVQPWVRLGDLATELAKIESVSDESIAGVRQKERWYEEYIRSGNYLFTRLWADTWCAAFVWKKTRMFGYPITEEIFRNIALNPNSVEKWMLDEIRRLAKQYQFFHWHLAFPDVFRVPGQGEDMGQQQAGWSGGFDVVLGNPPWERIKLQEKEWFAQRRPDIADAPNASARGRMIKALADEDPALFNAFLEDRREAEGESHFIRSSGRYPLCGRGDINTYAIFAEMNRMLISPTGSVGFISPSGIATDDTTKYFFADLMESQSLVSLYDFENRDGIFSKVHRSYKFCLLTLSGRPVAKGADFVFFAHKADDLRNESRHFVLTSDDLLLLNPETKTCPVFRDEKDYRLAIRTAQKAIFLTDLRSPRSEPIEVCLRVDNSKESKYFEKERGSEDKYLPFYEGKMIHQFDHRYASWNGKDFDYVPPSSKTLPFQVNSKNYLTEKTAKARYESLKDWYIGVRRLARSTDERTVIACILPYCCPAYSFNTFRMSNESSKNLFYLGALNSFVLDYLVRQKLGGANLTWSFQKQIPFTSYENAGPLRNHIDSSVLELTYTAWDLKAFARDCGYDGEPFAWDEDRRFRLRCELDAAYFHLYGIEREDVVYILDTFPIVKRKEEEAHGEYRTRRVILESYEAMQRAVETGEPYQTRLDPPPANPRVAHPAPVEM